MPRLKKAKDDCTIVFYLVNFLTQTVLSGRKGLFRNDVTLFEAFLDPHPPSCHAKSFFEVPPPPLPKSDVILNHFSKDPLPLILSHLLKDPLPFCH